MSGQIQPRNTAAVVRPVGGPVRVPVASPTMTPKEVVGILRRHIWMIILFPIAGLIVSGGAWALKLRFYPEYTAVAAIEVLPQGTTDPMDITSVQPDKEIQFQFRNTIAAMMRQQGLLQDFLALEEVRKTQWFGSFCESKDEQNRSSNEKASVRAFKNLQKKLGISPQREASYVNISLTCTGGSGKGESAKLVNLLVKLFLGKQLALAKADLTNKKVQLTEQQKRIAEDLRIQNGQLDIIRGGTEFGNISPIQFRDWIQEKLANVEIQIAVLSGDIARIGTVVGILKARSEGEHDVVVREQIERDPISSTMRRNIADMEVAMAGLTARLGENHRRVRQMRDAIEQARGDLANRQMEIGDIARMTQYALARDQLTAQTNELEVRNEELKRTQEQYRQLGKTRADYEKVLSKRDETQAMLATMNTHMEKVNSLLDAPDLSRVKSMAIAPEPLQVSAPLWQVYFPGGFMLGMIAGLGLAFVIEMLNDLLRTPSDVVRHLHVPLLGTICHEDEDYGLGKVDLNHVVRQAPFSVMSECYRQLKTNLKLSESASGRGALLVTSCTAGEGKTSVAVNMASSLAAEDHRVLFLDANFRRPSSHILFPHNAAEPDLQPHSDYGLSNYLMSQCDDLKEIVRKTAIEGFDVVDSGPLPDYPAELLGGERMKKLLETAGLDYDYVVIDGPPMLVSDAKMLAAVVDGTVLVCNAAMTRRGTAQRALRELRNVNATIAGTVLLGVRSLKGGYFEEVFKSYIDYQKMHVRSA